MLFDTDLNNEHEDEDKDEGGVEVGHVEGGAQASDEGVSSDNSCQQHGGGLR